VNPKDGVPVPTVEGNSLMLISCWPPGKSVKRIAVEAEL
jgi:sortase (surface protein transpeptidase)